MQYSHFSVISEFSHKKVHPFQTFLQFSLPPPYTKLKLEKNARHARPTIVCGVRGGIGPV